MSIVIIENKRMEMDELEQMAIDQDNKGVVGVCLIHGGRLLANYFRRVKLDCCDSVWISTRRLDPYCADKTLLRAGTFPINRKYDINSRDEYLAAPSNALVESLTPEIHWAVQADAVNGLPLWDNAAFDVGKMEQWHHCCSHFRIIFDDIDWVNLDRHWICRDTVNEEITKRMSAVAEESAGRIAMNRDRKDALARRDFIRRKIKEPKWHGRSNDASPDSHVYMMKDSNTGLYKIGKSINPKSRERTLQSEKPSIKMIFSHPELNRINEKTLHLEYSKYRVRGEWFDLTPAQVRKICHDVRSSANV